MTNARCSNGDLFRVLKKDPSRKQRLWALIQLLKRIGKPYVLWRLYHQAYIEDAGPGLKSRILWKIIDRNESRRDLELVLAAAEVEGLGRLQRRTTKLLAPRA